MHRVPVLWRAHRIHHADLLVDVTTAYRQHPIETGLRFGVMAATAWALGLPAATVAAYRLLSALNALLEHANLRVRPRLDAWCSLLVCTPHMHKIHHSRRQTQTDSNYGNILSAFDRLFGTFHPTEPSAHVTYGLDPYCTPEAQRLPTLLSLPFQKA